MWPQTNNTNLVIGHRITEIFLRFCRSKTEHDNCLLFPNAKAQHLFKSYAVNILAAETKIFAFESLDLKQSATMPCLQIA